MLNNLLKKHKLPLPDRGRKGSALKWDGNMSSNLGAQKKAFDAVLDASREIDFRHGTDIVNKFWKNIMENNFKMHP